MNWIFILFFLEILLFLFAFYLSGQDIMAPSVVMNAMFLLSTCFAIYANTKLHMKYGFESCIILIAGLTTFVLSEAIFRGIFEKKTHALHIRELMLKQKQPLKIVTVQSWVFVVLLIYDVIVILWYYREISHITGTGGSQAFGIFRGISTSTVMFSNEDRVINVWLSQFQKITLLAGYIAAYLFIQNLIEKRKKTFDNLCLFLLMVMSQGVEVFSGARTGILRLGSAYLIMYYISWHQKYGWNRNLSWKYIRICLLCVLIGAPLFFYVLPLLGRSSGERNIIDYITVYIGNPIWLFDLYVKNPIPSKGFGEESLCGMNSFLMRYLSMDTPVRNANLEFRRESGVNGNIYTFFRRPLHDFGFWGMLVFTVLVALLFSWIYYRKIKWCPRSKRTDGWTLVYGYLFYWLVVSSMVQFSFSYVAPGPILNMVLMVIGYRVMTRVRFVWRDRKVGTIPLKSSVTAKGWSS